MSSEVLREAQRAPRAGGGVRAGGSEENAVETAPLGGLSGESAEGEADAGCVGQGDHVVAPGECLSSIARATGHYWRSIWEHPANHELKIIRQDPHVLRGGDRVTIAPRQPKYEHGATEQRHRFVRRGEPACLRLVIREQDEPRANIPYVLIVEGVERRGFTDASGCLEQPIPASARTALLVLNESESREEYELDLGQLDPLETVAGVQGRLRNLGYDPGPCDGIIGPRTEAAIERFCFDQQLSPPPRGRIDPAMRERLRCVHGF